MQFYGNYIPQIEIVVNLFMTPKVGMNMLPLSRVCHNRSFIPTLARITKTYVMALLVPVRSKPNPNLTLIGSGAINPSWSNNNPNIVKIRF